MSLSITQTLDLRTMLFSRGEFGHRLAACIIIDNIPDPTELLEQHHKKVIKNFTSVSPPKQNFDEERSLDDATLMGLTTSLISTGSAVLAYTKAMLQ
jgi:hypothetical protein